MAEKRRLSLHPGLIDLPQEAKIKLAEIEQLMILSHHHTSVVGKKIEELANGYRYTRNLRIFDIALDDYKKNG